MREFRRPRELKDGVFRESEGTQRRRWTHIIEIPKRGGFVAPRGQKIQFDPANVVDQPIPAEIRQGLVLVFVD